MSIVSNFLELESDGLEFVVETNSGIAYASQSATARMLGVDESTVRRDLALGGLSVVNAQIPTPKGDRTSALLSASVVFKLAIKRNPDLAEKMGEVGANIYMLNAAGYKANIEESSAPTRIADPATLGANFYAWDDRKTPKVKWWLEKLVKQNKGKCVTLLREDVSGLALLDVFNAQTGNRVYTLFAFMENVSALVEMRQLMEERLKAGAKLIVRT